MENLFHFDNLIALVTLTVLEIVLGIDNVVFLSVLSGKLPAGERPRARKIGLSLAMIMRIGLLFSIGWVMRLTEPFFAVAGHSVSDEAYETVRRHFSESEIVFLSTSIATINAWNRLGAAFRFAPPIQKKVATAA